jgi:AcrR family transcriptional regulator
VPFKGVAAVPRTRSDAYDDKKRHILDVAASMFATLGYIGCKMEDVAEKCDVSKSMLYHYFKRKEDVLFEILQQHVSSLNKTIESYLQNTVDYKDKLKYFGGFIETYLERSSNARERHAVTLNDTRYLTREQIVLQEDLERRNVQLIVEILQKVNPRLTAPEYKVYALLLVGMINWVELWYRSSGSMSQGEVGDRISVLFLNGFLAKYKKRKSAR